MSELTISRQVWASKYRFVAPDGSGDASITETWDRVATALAAPETDPETWRPRFRAALDDYAFLPAGRILAGAGTNRAVTLFNCFVMGTIPDDMGGIFAHLREAALTLQQGGGIGYDFSTLRPKGAPVAGVGADASGPLSFMDVWDAMCRTIMSAGARRGAMMATLRCDHPDIEAFLDAKRDPARLRNFNLSVLVTDALIEAVDHDRPWPLVFDGTVYREVRARDLWDRLMRATYDCAEPGVVFIDRINQLNTLAPHETIAATNPCGEQPLPPYGACLLGSINLAQLVTDPFTANAALDLDRLDALVRIAVRMMDNVIEVSRFPLAAQAAEAQAKRRIGLGVTGLADALIYCQVRYGSAEAVALTERWLAQLRRSAYLASAELAGEKGSFPLYHRDWVMARPGIHALDADVRDEIARVGLRNALVTSIAPTGTISLVADNVSSGIEPVFAWSLTRRVRERDGGWRTETVSDPAYRRYRRMFGAEAPLPDWFVTAGELTPAEHVAMQAAAQTYIDSSISKTINCREDLAFEAFKQVYRLAYDSGCKGCTTYRPNPISGAILTEAPEAAETAAAVAVARADGEPDAAAEAEAEAEAVRGASLVAAAPAPPTPAPLARPETLPGETYKVRWPTSDHALYITINDIIEDGRRRPFEVFINSKNMEHYAWTVALTLMISAVFRRGGDVSFVVEELKAVFDPRGGQWIGRRYVPSIMAAIGEVIERHMVAIGFLVRAEADRNDRDHRDGGDGGDGTGDDGAGDRRPSAAIETAGRVLHCPKCHAPGLVRREGCDICLNCGYSHCG